MRVCVCVLHICVPCVSLWRSGITSACLHLLSCTLLLKGRGSLSVWILPVHPNKASKLWGAGSSSPPSTAVIDKCHHTQLLTLVIEIKLILSKKLTPWATQPLCLQCGTCVQNDTFYMTFFSQGSDSFLPKKHNLLNMLRKTHLSYHFTH